MKKIFSFLFFILLFNNFSLSFADTSSTDYNDINFPQWTKDLRRTEIITFGSLPFVTLWTSLGYGLIVQGSFHNPLDKSTSNYTESQQKQIISIAAGVSLTLGLTDLFINVISRNIKKRKQDKIEKTIIVIPKREINNNDFSEKTNENDEFFIEKKEEDINENSLYFIKGLENAVF